MTPVATGIPLALLAAVALASEDPRAPVPIDLTCGGAAEYASFAPPPFGALWVGAGGTLVAAPPADRETYLASLVSTCVRRVLPLPEASLSAASDRTLEFAAFQSDDARWRLSPEEIATLQERVTAKLAAALSVRPRPERAPDRLVLLVQPTPAIQSVLSTRLGGPDLRGASTWLVVGRASPVTEALLPPLLDGLAFWEEWGFPERLSVREAMRATMHAPGPRVAVFGGWLEGSVANALVALAQDFFAGEGNRVGRIAVSTTLVTSGLLPVPITGPSPALHRLVTSIAERTGARIARHTERSGQTGWTCEYRLRDSEARALVLFFGTG